MSNPYTQNQVYSFEKKIVHTWRATGHGPRAISNHYSLVSPWLGQPLWDECEALLSDGSAGGWGNGIRTRMESYITCLVGLCCVFWQANRCFKCCSLVEIIFLSTFSCFYIFFCKNEKKHKKVKNTIFNQQTAFEAPVCWLKYPTGMLLLQWAI